MVERWERKWIAWFAFLVCLVTSIPYLLGYYRQGADWAFTGFLFGVEDGNSYIAKMLSGAYGAWLFRTPYSPFDQAGGLVYLPYLLLGNLSAPPGQHEQLGALYQIFRAGAAALLVWATYDFIAIFIEPVRWRRWGTALASIGGGLGWLSLVGLGSLWSGKIQGLDMPLEFYSPETFGFLMIFGLPHLACARAFLLWGLRGYLLPEKYPIGWKNSLKMGLVWTVVGVMQPLTILSGWVAIGMHVLLSGLWNIRAKSQHDWGAWFAIFKRAVWLGLLSLPFPLYTILTFQLDPFFHNWQAQNNLISPPLYHYLLAYAVALPFALAGARAMIRSQNRAGWLPLGWTLVFPVLIYLPISVQRRLVEGAWISLWILALWFLQSRNHKWQWGISVGLSTSFLTAVILIGGAGMAAWNTWEPVFRPAAEVRLFKYLASIARPGEVVMAPYEVSNPLPAWAPVRSMTGHGPESMHGNEMRKVVETFYQSVLPPDQNIALLNRYHVAYVIWKPAGEDGWNPNQAVFLRLVYHDGPYLLYKVVSPLPDAAP